MAAKRWATRLGRLGIWLGGLGGLGLLTGGLEGSGQGVFPQTDPFVCRVWRAEDGLPQDSVWAILQSRDGYLWIGTGGGLARFDGVRFQVFGMDQGLPSLHVRALLEDRQGTLWIGTANGLCRLEAGQLTSWTATDGLAGDTITDLAQDGAGTLWIGTTSGLSRWRRGRFEPLPSESALARQNVRALAIDGAGAVWVAPTSRGLARWDGRGFVEATRSPETQQFRPYHLVRDRANRLWGAGLGQVFCFADGDVKTYGLAEGLPEILITCLTASADGTIWAGTLDQGLFYLRDGRFHQVNQPDGLSDEAVRVVAEDLEHNLWVGTRSGGLNRLRPREFSTRRLLGAKSEMLPVSLAEADDGALWVGTLGHGLYRLAGGRQEEFLHQELAELAGYNLQVGAVLLAGDGRLWVGAGTGLLEFKPGAAPVVSPYRGNAVRCLCEDRREGLWIGSQGGVLRRLCQGRLETFTNGLPHGPLTALIQAPDGALWLGSYGGGVGRFQDGKGSVFGKAEGLGSDLIHTLCLDARGTLWIGTEGGGLGRFQAGRITRFSKQRGLIDDTVLQILEDDTGDLWLGTHHGIARVARSELDSLAAGAPGSIHPRAFGRADGMQSEECAGGFRTCLKTRGGRLCFSTGRGIVMIDPKAQRGTGPAPTVWLEEVLVDGQPRSLVGAGSRSVPLRIPPGKSRLEFHYTGLSFAAPERVRFRYRLEGLEAGWVEAGSRRMANYSYVPPGRYRFAVEAHNGDGRWSETQASVALRVLPRFWQTWWFLALATTGGAGGIAWTVRAAEKRKVQARLQRLEVERATDRERARIARDIHDDLGARLTKISMLTERAEREAGADTVLGGHVRNIYSTAREMLKQLDETVWAVNPRNDQLDRLAEYILQNAEEFFRHTNIRCRLKVLGEIPPLPIAAEPRHHLFLAVREALTNAARHSAATEVELQLEYSAGAFAVAVRDNGRGFDATECLARGRGLENMRARLEKLGGALELQTQPGHGATIRMKFALAAARLQGE